jgi:hypothetical protein
MDLQICWVYSVLEKEVVRRIDFLFGGTLLSDDALQDLLSLAIVFLHDEDLRSEDGDLGLVGMREFLALLLLLD